MVSIESTYKLQKDIEKLEDQLIKLKDEYNSSITELIKDDRIETKYYKLSKITKTGRSFIDIPKFIDLYKGKFNKVAQYKVTIADARKVLSENEISKILKKHKDIITYEIIKKA